MRRVGYFNKGKYGGSKGIECGGYANFVRKG